MYFIFILRRTGWEKIMSGPLPRLVRAGRRYNSIGGVCELRRWDEKRLFMWDGGGEHKPGDLYLEIF